MLQSLCGFTGLHLNLFGADPTGLIPGLGIKKYFDVIQTQIKENRESWDEGRAKGEMESIADEEAIFDYTISASKDDNKITRITENGTIKPYDVNKNKDFDPKPLFDRLTAPADVIKRMTPLWNSLKDNKVAEVVGGGFVLTEDTYELEHPRNLVSSNISFPAYGININYTFVYSDDKTLRDETYLRKITKDENYQLPVRHRESVIAPNVKQTNYDADQKKEGSKSVSFDSIFKSVFNFSSDNYY